MGAWSGMSRLLLRGRLITGKSPSLAGGWKLVDANCGVGSLMVLLAASL